MFCPKCRATYSDSFQRCGNCAVDLVAEDTPGDEAADEDIKWVHVCTPIDMNQVVFIKSLLQSEEIPFFIEGENQNTLFAPFRPIPMRVFVPEKYAETADDLLRDLR